MTQPTIPIFPTGRGGGGNGRELVVAGSGRGGLAGNDRGGGGAVGR